MKGRTLENISASVHQRLLNKAKESHRPFNELLQYFAMERFLYRLSQSNDRSKFILKGGLLLPIWEGPQSRSTKDIDFLGKLDNNPDVIAEVMKNACRQDVEPDGMLFDASSVTAVKIIEGAEYNGIRIIIRGGLGKARVSLQIDVGFGDVIVPKPLKIVYPVILDFPTPVLSGYSMESVIAEKFETMIKMGVINSRMKDFYDIWHLSRRFIFSSKVLAAAIQSTFENRDTDLPVSPSVLDASFANSEKEMQWHAFIKKSGVTDASHLLSSTIDDIAVFLKPVCSVIIGKTDSRMTWSPPGPWSD